jgi:hypothetical protein
LKGKLPSEKLVYYRISCLATSPTPLKKMEDLLALITNLDILPKT